MISSNTNTYSSANQIRRKPQKQIQPEFEQKLGFQLAIDGLGNEIKSKDSNKKLELIIDSFQDLSIWMVDAQFRIVRANSHFRHEYSVFSGKTFRKNKAFIGALTNTEHEQAEIQLLFNRCLNGESIHEDTKLFGSLHEVDLKPIKTEDGSIEIICYCKNIEEKRQLELENAYQNERWKIAVEGNEYGMWDWDIKKNKLYFSPSCYKLLGFDESDGIDGQVEDWCARIHPEDLAKSGGNLLNIISGMSDSFKTEIRIRCKNGEYKWILDHGKAYGKDERGFPTNIIGLMKDISESKLAEKRLQDQLNRLEHFAHLTSHSLRLPVASILGLTSLVEEIDQKEELIKVAQYLKSSALALDEVIREMNDALTQHNQEREIRINNSFIEAKETKSKRA
jgi:PAS domain S-box-containing protein